MGSCFISSLRTVVLFFVVMSPNYDIQYAIFIQNPIHLFGLFLSSDSSYDPSQLSTSAVEEFRGAVDILAGTLSAILSVPFVLLFYASRVSLLAWCAVLSHLPCDFFG